MIRYHVNFTTANGTGCESFYSLTAARVKFNKWKKDKSFTKLSIEKVTYKEIETWPSQQKSSSTQSAHSTNG